jgi:hypothetical protein
MNTATIHKSKEFLTSFWRKALHCWINYQYFCLYNVENVRYMFRPLKQVVIRNSVFWHITPCSPLKVNRLFGETSCFRLQCWRISQAGSQYEAGNFHRTTRRCVSEKIELIITAVRTSNPA